MTSATLATAMYCFFVLVFFAVAGILLADGLSRPNKTTPRRSGRTSDRPAA